MFSLMKSFFSAGTWCNPSQEGVMGVTQGVYADKGFLN